MLSFVDFLSEAGDQPYDFHKDKDSGHPSIHQYNFKDHKGDNFQVHIEQHPSEHGTNAEVAFHNDTHDHKAVKKTSYDKTGRSGSSAVKVFSTVKHILKHHSDQHPHLKSYSFEANKKDPSRVALYARMTRHMGGATEDGLQSTFHQIPVK